MNTNPLPDEVKAQLDGWMPDDYKILYFWDDGYDDTFFITCENEGVLFFLRIFRLGKEYSISQDHQTNLKER